ncbi:MAG: gamma-glutamyl-gamma-aminobutyrate hydrolase family protein [Bacteroidia bacterium]|nr:gamma-glutamyl-gamma-aminobutyrate hydrolase family protein [Bacteroidia bacterium]
MIKIGVTSCFMYPDPTRLVFGHKSLNYLEADMGRYLSRQGVMPILIPDLPKAELISFLKEMDAFVLQGGSDLSPSTYGETPIIEGKWLGDKYRDEYELGVLDFALKNEKPVLGICRGFQLMNAYFGGTLYQDIKTQRPEALLHRDADLYDQLNHKIEWSVGSLMQRLYTHDPHDAVNTVHHQGLKTVGKGLEVNAFSPEDGIVEAFVWNGAEPGKVMGVQWHPEFHYNSKTPLVDPEVIYDHFLGFVGK